MRRASCSRRPCCGSNPVWCWHVSALSPRAREPTDGTMVPRTTCTSSEPTAPKSPPRHARSKRTASAGRRSTSRRARRRCSSAAEAGSSRRDTASSPRYIPPVISGWRTQSRRCRIPSVHRKRRPPLAGTTAPCDRRSSLRVGDPMPSQPDPRQRARFVLALVAAGVLGLVTWNASSSLGTDPPVHSHMGSHMHAAMPMTDADMKQWVDDFYAKNPRRGVDGTGIPVDTFLVVNFFFNNDNVIGDTDTADVFVGETVLWKFVSGFHTTTNGTGFEDPTSGTLWDQPIDPDHTEFAYQFDSEGIVPFFCRPHEPGMPGYVNVHAPTDVVPVRAAEGLGFTTNPFPNPTRAGASFRFALGKTGRALVEVFDVRG